jgi:type VI secretion system secreted protein Hcp
MAVADYFLKIDGIEGESADSKHKGEIQLESFSFGGTQSGSYGHGGGGGAGKVQLQDFHFTKKVDKGSAKLFLSCCNGAHIKFATLVARKAGKDQQEFLTVKLSDIIVSSYQSSGSDGSSVIPVEQISLNFGKVEFEYKEQKVDGSLGGAVKAGWDLKTNKAV